MVSAFPTDPQGSARSQDTEPHGIVHIRPERTPHTRDLARSAAALLVSQLSIQVPSEQMQ